MKLKTLDLFSGIGGFARGLEATDFFEKEAEKWKP
jgi:site-specific DNA-cytosine methylase